MTLFLMSIYQYIFVNRLVKWSYISAYDVSNESLWVTVSILSGRFGALIVVVEAWNFFYILIKVSWVQKSTNGKKFSKGKIAILALFLKFWILYFVLNRDHVTANELQSTCQTKAHDQLNISALVKSSKKNIFNPFRSIFFKNVQKLRSQKMTKLSITFQKGWCLENSFA